MLALVFVVLIPMAFLVAFVLIRHLFRPGVRRSFVQCGFKALAEILEFAKRPGGRHEVLDLHLPLPLDGYSEP